MMELICMRVSFLLARFDQARFAIEDQPQGIIALSKAFDIVIQGGQILLGLKYTLTEIAADSDKTMALFDEHTVHPDFDIFVGITQEIELFHGLHLGILIF